MSSPPAKGPKLPLSVILALHPANIDAFLSHLHRCLQTPSGIDTVLLFVGYASRLTASLLISAPLVQLQQSARDFLAKLVALRTSGAAAVSGKAAAAGPSAGVLSAAKSLRALGDLLSEFRMFMRLWSLLGMYGSLKGLVRRELSGQGAKLGAMDRFLPWIQLSNGVACQALENGAYLASKGILPWKPATIGWSMKWSVRFFAAIVGIELGKLLVERATKDTAVEKAESAEAREWREKWNRSFVANLAWAPLTAHWSLDQGFLSEMGIGALATVPGIIQMSKLWKDTA